MGELNKLHEESDETCSSSDIDYIITKLTQDDAGQVILLNRKNTIFADPLKIANIIIENCFAIKSDDFVLCYFGFVQYKEIKDYIAKKSKKTMRGINEDFKILLFERIQNTPLNIILDGLTNLNIEGEFVLLSRCCELQGNDYLEICEDFKEYQTTELKYFPEKIEEIFFLDFNMGYKMFCVRDVYYRYFNLSKECFSDFITKLGREIKHER